ncbi:MAG TPA: LptF/LptG family permease [Longimicrobiales bacterium]
MLRAHLAPFLFALFALTSLLFVNTVARRFPDMAGKGLPMSVILEVMALSLPHIIALTLPMAVLVAVLYAFSQMTADNEVTALKASGVNLLRLQVSLVIAAAVLGAFMLYFNDRILPETNHQLKVLLMDINRKNPTLTLKEQVINNIQTADMRTRYFLQAARIDARTNKLRDVVIYDLSVPQRDRTVYADSGRMAFNREQTNLFLTLYDGSVHEVRDAEPDQFQRVFFKQQLVMVEGIGNVLERTAQDEYRSDREMSLGMLKAAVDSSEAQLAEIREEARKYGATAVREVMGRGSVEMQAMQTASELRMLAARAQAEQRRSNEFRVEYHKKFAIPFACIVFVLIGAPLAVRFPRGGPGMVIAVSLLIFGIYYMSLIGGESLGDKGSIKPFWGPWAPNLLFLILSIFGLARMGREKATTRGGGWSDLMSSIGGALTPWRRRRA